MNNKKDTTNKKEDLKGTKISIIVPVHNDEEYVGVCIEQLIQQTLEEIEIFLVDDASTDNSLNIINEYASKDSRIKVIHFTENRSAFQARKAGIEQSRSPYIMFADADDLLEKNACEILWKLENKNPVDILHFGTNVITDCNDKKVIEGYKKLINPRKELLYCGEIFKAFTDRNFEGHLWNKIFNRELCIYALSKTENIILPKGQDKYFYWIMAFYARTYQGCPDYCLYNYRYGLGVESAGGYIDLNKFELFCKQSWTENAIERFMSENADVNLYQDILKKSRNNLLRHCVKNWKNLDNADRATGLSMMREYWNKPEDIGELVGALCDHYKDNQENLIDMIKDYQEKYPNTPRNIKTIGTYYYIYNNGGIQRVMSKLMQLWINMGYKVVLITDFEKENDFDLPEGVERVNCVKSGNASARKYSERGRNLEQIIREYNIDVMVYHAYLGQSLLWDLLLCKFMNVPFFIYYHNVFAKYILFQDKRFYTVPEISQLADGMAVLSNIDRKFWSCFNNNVHLVKNPLTFELQDISLAQRDNKFIIWVGRLDEIHKRFQEPITIFRKVLEKEPDAKLFIVGKDESGKNYKRLQDRIKKLHLEDSVFLCGFQKDVAPFYQSASVYLMTSTHEGSPMTLIEALSFGLPTVMYDLPYLALVDGNEGIISVKQEDVTSAADAICKLLNDKEYRIQVGNKGRKYLENTYINDDITKEWENILESIYIKNTALPSDPVDILMWKTVLMHYKFMLNNNSQDSKLSEELEREKKNNRQSQAIIKQLEYNTYCLDETRKSFSYRLGLLITSIPRKILSFFRKE